MINLYAQWLQDLSLVEPRSGFDCYWMSQGKYEPGKYHDLTENGRKVEVLVSEMADGSTPSSFIPKILSLKTDNAFVSSSMMPIAAVIAERCLLTPLEIVLID